MADGEVEDMECEERWGEAGEVSMDCDLSETQQEQLITEITHTRDGLRPVTSLESFDLPTTSEVHYQVQCQRVCEHNSVPVTYWLVGWHLWSFIIMLIRISLTQLQVLACKSNWDKVYTLKDNFKHSLSLSLSLSLFRRSCTLSWTPMFSSPTLSSS